MTFKPMLAYAPKDLDKELDTLEYPVFVSPKLDGIRSLSTSEGMISRNLKPIRNAFVQQVFSDLVPDIDGELIVGLPTDPLVFRTTSSGVMSGDGTPDVYFYVFDIVPSITNGLKTDAPFRERYAKLVNLTTNRRVKVVEHLLVHSKKELLEVEQNFLAMGYEGLMIRTMDGTYKFGRSSKGNPALMKVKRFGSHEATIIGFKERMHNANEAKVNALGHTERSSHKENKVGRGDLGALVCKYGEHEFDVGTGFDDELRALIWNNRTLYLGSVIRFKDFTYGNYDKPRFPVFEGFRDKDDI